MTKAYPDSCDDLQTVLVAPGLEKQHILVGKRKYIMVSEEKWPQKAFGESNDNYERRLKDAGYETLFTSAAFVSVMRYFGPLGMDGRPVGSTPEPPAVEANAVVNKALATIKESNPKDALGIAKIPMSTVPVPVLMELALALMEGGLKYGRHNYRAIGIRYSVYYDAAMRHLGAWWEGEDIDADSGLSHVTKAIATLVVLRDAMIRDKAVDDRPPATLGFISKLNEKAAALLVKYPESEDPFLGTNYEPTEYVE